VASILEAGLLPEVDAEERRACRSRRSTSCGDVIATGAPSGVGNLRQPRVWLRSGDEIVISSPQLGAPETTIA
jgi:Fumarylacetoacetate (FAA) hydrolase family